MNMRFTLLAVAIALLIIDSVLLESVMGEDSQPAIAASSDLIFREDWKETPEEVPVSQDHVANDDLVVARHGPDADMIKKSHHDDISDDPWYVWSGLCRKGRWAISLRKPGALIDLTRGGKIRWRTKQSGLHTLKVIIELENGTWLVSEQGAGETSNWHVSSLELCGRKQDENSIRWQELDIETVTAGARISDPELSRVRSVGWTDLTLGNVSKGCTRVDWIEVYGKEIRP